MFFQERNSKLASQGILYYELTAFEIVPSQRNK